MDLLKQCQLWCEQGEGQKIIDALEAIPSENRTPEIDSELGRAYNMIADDEHPEFYEKALALLLPHEDYFQGDHCWNYRVGSAYYYLDQEGPALRYFEKALEARPGDEDTQEYIDDCRSRLALPRFEQNFRERTQASWAAFSAIEAELRQIIDTDKTRRRGEELMEICGNALKIALGYTSFELGFNGEKYELILSPEGHRSLLFPLVYFQRHAPAATREHWDILVGRQRTEGFMLRSGDLEVRTEDVQMWAEETENRQVSLVLYCQKLTPLLKEDPDRVWWALSMMVDQVLGEVSAIAFVAGFDVYAQPKDEPAMLLSELPELLQSKGFALWDDGGDYLKESYLAYELEPVEDPEADWRLDVYTGSTRLPVLINDYMSAHSDTVDEYHKNGIAAGFFCYPLENFTGEERSRAILDFRDDLRDAIQNEAGEDAVTFLGGATGLFCGYLDFIAWDLLPVLNAAKAFFEESGLPWAQFHAFRRNVGGVPLLETAEESEPIEPEIYEETGSLLSPEDIEAMEAMDDGVSGYFGKMLDYLENKIKTGVSQGRFTEQQAREDLQIALWYAFACNNIDEYEYYYRAAQWMPDSEKNAAGCGTWYYRYACALIYCSRLEEALHYLRRGTEEEPDYPWTWLQLGRLLSHFGDKDGALAAAERGLALVPGDHEFLTLRADILAGRTLEQMEYHWIDAECDRRLQEGLDAGQDEKMQAIAGIVCNTENLAAIKEILAPTEWEADAPFCTCSMAYGDGMITGRFFMNEAALSKLPADWVRELVRRLPELERRGKAFLSAQAGVGTEGLELEWFTVHQNRCVHLSFRSGDDRQVVRFEADFSVSKEDQPAMRCSDGGNFLAFVLLKEPAWDADQFRKDLRDDWGIPCMTAERVGEDGDSTLVFDVAGMTAAVSLLPCPVPHGEAVENAARNYLWPEAAQTIRSHQGQILVSVMAREQDPLEAARLQVKLVCCACKQVGALGIYTNGTVYEPDYYLQAAAMMQEGEFPLLNAVWFGLYRSDDGLNAYTDGLRSFGKDELEILDTAAEPAQVRNFLIDVTAYLLEQDATLHDGETIGADETERLPITRSTGAWHDGMTLKIGYMPRREAP